MSKTGKKKGNVIRVDFTGVETRVLLPEGQYLAKVVETSQEEGSGEYPYIKWVFAVIDDDQKFNDKKLFLNTSLSPKSLWNLKNLLETLGVDTPADEGDIDLNACVDLQLMVRVEHRTWEGKDQANITDFTPVDEAEDEKPAKGGKKVVPEDDDEEEEEVEEEEDEDDGKVTADEIREMDGDELKDLVKKHKLKLDLDKMPKASKRIAAVIDAMESKDLLAE